MKRYRRDLLIMALLACSHAAASTTTLAPIGTSAPLRELALTARALATQMAREPEPPLRIVVPRAASTPRVGAEAARPQYTLPAGAGVPALPAVRTSGSTFNIEGLRAGAGGAGGALGDMQYVQHADGLLAVYRKADGALLLGPVLANAMYVDAPAGRAADACASRSISALSVHFDQLARRWVIAHSAAAHGLHYQCVAVSANADATGSYHRYALQMQALYFDDLQLAVWPNAYYFSVNLFDTPTGAYRGPRICGIERQALLAGTAAVMRCRDLGPARAPVTPASLQGDAGAAQNSAPALFLALDNGQRLLLWRFSVFIDRLDDPVALPVAQFSGACPAGAACIAQPAPGGLLATAGERLVPHPVFNNNDGRAVLLATHSVGLADGQLAVRWYEIRDPLGAARVYQQGSFAPDRTSRWMGSIGMDKAGNIALGYAVASSDTPAGIRYAGRQRTDPPGRLQAEQVIFNGNGVQPGQAMLARASGALSLDPVDGCTFWYTQHYLPSTGSTNWRTRISSFKFETCQ
jgi:hypothetical protein